MAASDEKTQTSMEQRFKERLVELGLLRAIKPPLPASGIPKNRQPIRVEGKPLSEFIIEERR